ncbi:LysR family transcriptional regulator [Piscinibacter sakaiensis]|uniref:Transcriptional regulator, LysR family n=1 Tax=Piscinibacter sakaiensis TaxID=1547922 RepID=A0A0K8P044_PISS1|nr:LysR family transcriptional regulator [Piscinibacter sakaiensis]GAP36022.1 transcriptional regulator, LysR family [Piscinibacter sakaiensis]
MSPTTSLVAYTAFARAYELGSFSAVARELGLTQSTVSKHIAGLEAALGVQLFARTTRQLNPTHEATRLYEGVLRLLEAAEALPGTIGSTRAEPAGLLRLSLPHAYGRARLMPLVIDFLAAHPKVRLDLRLSDAPAGLVEDGVELAVRLGELGASSLVARALGVAEQRVVAAPAYLARHGEPRQPSELVEHACIVVTDAPRGQRWVFESEQGRQVVEVGGPLAVDSVDAAYLAVLAGVGIARLPDWVVGPGLASGALRALLPEHDPLPLPVQFVYPQTRVLSARARAFIDFVVARLAA